MPSLNLHILKLTPQPLQTCQAHVSRRYVVTFSPHTSLTKGRPTYWGCIHRATLRPAGHHEARHLSWRDGIGLRAEASQVQQCWPRVWGEVRGCWLGFRGGCAPNRGQSASVWAQTSPNTSFWCCLALGCDGSTGLDWARPGPALLTYWGSTGLDWARLYLVVARLWFWRGSTGSTLLAGPNQHSAPKKPHPTPVSDTKVNPDPQKPPTTSSTPVHPSHTHAVLQSPAQTTGEPWVCWAWASKEKKSSCTATCKESPN